MRVTSETDEKLFRELTRAKIRSLNAISEKNELKNKILNGEYISREIAHKEHADIINNAKQKLLIVPSKIAPACEKLSAGEIYAIVYEAIVEALQELSEEI